MDAVVTGLIGGSTVSLLLIVGGGVALYSGLWEKMSSPNIIFAWLCLLTALTIGQLYITYITITTFAAVPQQDANAVVH